MAGMAISCWKWIKMAGNCKKWLDMNINGWNDLTWLEMAGKA